MPVKIRRQWTAKEKPQIIQEAGTISGSGANG
jgi:hypothetical protein